MALRNTHVACLAVLLVAGWTVMAPAGAGAQPVDLEGVYQQRSVVPQPAQQPADEKPAAGSHVVTSVSKCFEDLGPEEAAEIKRNSLTPYADCQKRLRERAKSKKAQEAETPVAETPRNYRRVVDGDAAPERAVPKEGKRAVKPAKEK